MKKILFFMMSVLLMMSCGESASVNGGEGNENGGVQPSETRATQVFMQGKDLSAGYTRAMAVNTEDASDVLPDLDEENKDLENSAEQPALPSAPEYGNGNVEVNIHQQEHSTWDEIKTSIHVRDLVDEVKVEIPIGFDNVAESDDFAIRTYDYALESKVFINGAEYALNDATNPIRISVEHQATKVVITISAISHDYVKALREAYGDGITVEVHTYPKNMTNADVWSAIKKSAVTVVPSSYSNILKSTTSAFFDN